MCVYSAVIDGGIAVINIASSLSLCWNAHRRLLWSYEQLLLIETFYLKMGACFPYPSSSFFPLKILNKRII